MLRQVFIIKDGEILYKRDFGKALDDDGYRQAYKELSKEGFKLTTEQIQFHDFFKYRLNYLALPKYNLLFLFVSDLSDKFSNVKKELIRCRKEFMDMFGSILDEKLDADTFEIFDPTIDLIHKNLRPKISLVGFSGVGKTTITRLITAEDIPTEHIPTITGDVGTIKIGKLFFHLWDFAGQEEFSFLWKNFIKGSDAVLLITDSTLENCEKSKYFVELIKKEAPYSHAATIGNKQDLPEAMPIIDIERHLGTKAYSMIATDPDNRNKMITIIADILEMSGEISPLLKPLIDRDKKIKEAENALETGDVPMAIKIFEDLADLSLELGDDRVSQDFHEKAEKIRSILQQTSVPLPSEIQNKEISEEQKIPEKDEQPTNEDENKFEIDKIESSIDNIEPPVQPPSPPSVQPPSPPSVQPPSPPSVQPPSPPSVQPPSPPSVQPPSPPS
ncbi:MAG: ADP-ribosylation factor-like protein, partial [Promethearchaeota archaeon]